MNRHLPVTVIGGYLGCGKTTLVNHLLRHSDGMRLAVLVNDFGALPIDADLIESQDGDVISLSGGCICCSYGNDLGEALLNLQSADRPIDQVLIESSGVALPGAIGSSLTLLRDFRLHCIAVMVDVETIRQHATDKYLADTIEKQLFDADLILLNKVDLVNKEYYQAVQKWVVTMNSAAHLVSTEQAAVTPAVILDKHWRQSTDEGAESDAINVPEFPRLSGSTPVHGPAVFDSIEFALTQRYRVDVLAKKLAASISGIVRAKGFVPGPDGTLKTLQIVGSRWTVSNAPTDATAGLVCIGRTGEVSGESVRDWIDSAVEATDL